jgi:transposase
VLSLTNLHRYLLYRGVADMRKSFDSLAGIVRREMHMEPLKAGDIFIFLNRQRNQVKLLTWDGDGWAIYYKRLESGTYELPEFNTEGTSCQMRTDELQLILGGISLKNIKRRKRYQGITQA